MSIDTLSISKEFAAKGFTVPQAEILAGKFAQVAESECNVKNYLETRIAHELVTKDHLKAEMSNLVTKDYLDAKLADIKTEFAEVRTEIAEVRTEIKDSKIETIKWMVGLHLTTIFATLTLIVGLIYFLLNPLILR